MVSVHIFLLCYNEEFLLPKTIHHYKTYLPNCHITIYDNESTDNSVNIAKQLGCSIVSWKTTDEIDDEKYVEIKNTCWNGLHDGAWVIVGDMDEWFNRSQGSAPIRVKYTAETP